MTALVKYVSTYKIRSVNDLFDDVYAHFFLIFLIKAYVVGTHLNCMDQFKWVLTTYAFIKKYNMNLGTA